MKSKTIKTVLRKKFDAFLKSIKDPKVQTLVGKNSIITGGAIASMLQKEEVNDYDVYFTNKETVLAVCEYYTKIFNEKNNRHSFKILDTVENNDYEGRITIQVQSKGVAAEDDFKHSETPDHLSFYNMNIEGDAVEDGGNASDVFPSMTTPEDVTESPDKKGAFRPIYISSNAITLADDFQLIIRFYGDADKIHENYDFEHCKCWWTSNKGHLELPSGALECMLTKELRYSGSKYPLASIIRSRKFINRGFTINAGQYLKMCMQLNDLNLRDLEVLTDQLTGVDAYWFARMLACIDAEKLESTNDNDYVFNLIDRFF